MLKINSKKARANLRQYIIDNYDPCGYDLPEASSFEQTATNIYNTFKAETKYFLSRSRYAGADDYLKFEDWCRGLPSIIDTCYYYNRSAIEDLGNILEETEAEKAKFTEERAEHTLTLLIYNEIIKAVRKNSINVKGA